MKRRTFLGSALAAVAGVFGAKSLVARSENDTIDTFSATGRMISQHPKRADPHLWPIAVYWHIEGFLDYSRVQKQNREWYWKNCIEGLECVFTEDCLGYWQQPEWWRLEITPEFPLFDGYTRLIDAKDWVYMQRHHDRTYWKRNNLCVFS